MFWNVLGHRLIHLLCLRKMCLQQHRHGLHLCQSHMRRRRFIHLSLLTLMCSPRFRRQHPQKTMIPCHFPPVEDTPPWFYQEPETPWISTEEDTPGIIPQQVPSPPIQIPPSREETNMSTGVSISPPPPWFDETPQPASTVREDVLPLVPVFDETPVPSVSKRWRSGTLHPETHVPSVSKCWRSDMLHPETPVPTTVLPQLRWRAGVLRALRPFRRLQGKQPDPSEISAKRPPLALAQVMTTAVAKHGDWSLGFDERGPVFDRIQDWRHSIFLTRRAARKEVYFAFESPENKRLLLAAMEREWKKWEGHKATLPLSQCELRMLKFRFSNLKIVSTRWVLTPKESDFKARLVVQGCQEDPSMMRTDSPTGSRDRFFLVLSSAAQEHLSCGSADVAFAYLQAGGIERLLLLMMPNVNRHQDVNLGKCAWLEEVSVELATQAAPGINTYATNLRASFEFMRVLWKRDSISMSSMVGSLLSRSPMSMICSLRMTCVAKPPSRCWMPLRKSITCLKSRTILFFCGRRVRVTPDALIVSQELAASSPVPMELFGTHSTIS